MVKKRNKLTDEQKEQRTQEKHDKFRELAPKRVNKLLNVGRSIRLLGTYPASDEEKQDILDAVEKLHNEIKSAFAGEKKTSGFQFSK